MTLRAPDLIDTALVAPERLGELHRIAAQFAVALTEDVAALIDPSDPADPIAAQFVPTAAELETASEELGDPIGDEKWSPVPGIVHRHRDRVLLKPTLLCPVYCRFCFRREVVGQKAAMLRPAVLEAAFDYIREHSEIWEVIVTGGDPLLLSPRRVDAIMRTLEAIPHVKVIRFHTRVPVVDPTRVKAALLSALDTAKALYIVIHVNHPRELTPIVRAALSRIVRSGIPVLAQTVLLRGVNDDAAVLEDLFRALVAIRVKPYYLHQGDLARGTAHFRVPIETGQRLVRVLRSRASGLCQPTYVLDIPGGFGKVPIAASAIEPAAAPGEWIVEDGAGRRHPYPPNPQAARK